MTFAMTLALMSGLVPVVKLQTPPVPVVKAPLGPPEFELKFADESTVRAVLLDTMVTVQTKYGKLQIPIADIRRVELGFRYPDGLEAKINAAIAELGATDFAKREAATATLTEAKEFAVPLLKIAAKSSDAEVVKRVDTILKSIKDKLPSERGDPKLIDTIETAEFTFQGKLETLELKAKTKYFAASSLKVAEMRTLRMAGVDANELVTFDTAQYGRLNDHTWMQSKVDINAGRGLEISVTGTIDLYPQQPGQYLVSANGQPQQGMTQVMISNGRMAQYNAGTMLGKIGVNGEVFVIGSNFKNANITQSGKLYLKMAPSPWGNSTGTYKLTIKAGG